MNQKLGIIFLFIVLLPLGMLAWLGVRVAGNEREDTEKRFEAFVQERLAEWDRSIAALLDQRQRELLIAMETLSLEPIALRAAGRSHSAVRQFILLDASGELTYPSERAGATQSEREFLRRTDFIWRNRELADIPTEDANPSSGRSSRPLSGPVHGWYTWFQERGVHLILWQRRATGEIIGAELDRSRLLADVIARLPQTEPGEEGAMQGRTVLVGAGGDVIYQWGDFEPVEQAVAWTSRSLSHPLDSWRIDFFPAPDAFGSQQPSSLWFNLLSGLGAMGIALLSLAFYFYRENTRQIREAAQRVNFVNQVSHELKTPLTNIRMYAELLEQNIDSDDPEVAKDLGVIVSESQRLSRLIGNILAFSRKERNKLTLHMVEGDVDDTIASVIEHFRPILEAKQMAISFEHAAEGKTIYDPDALEQILGNLLSNAEKYAPGTSVVVRSSREGEKTIIDVVDSGPGIGRENAEKIFAPFFRPGDSLTEGQSGTGIGLTISRELARMHGGDLELISSPQGAHFRVTLGHGIKSARGAQ